MHIIGLLLGLLPASRLKNQLMTWCVPGWTVAPDARIGPCVLWQVAELQIRRGGSVGFGTAFRTLRRVAIGESAEIGQLNWFSAAGRFAHDLDADLAGSLVMADHSAITSRHYIDCSGGLSIGEASGIGGVRSVVVTHGVDLETSTVQARPVRIGERTIVMTGVIITQGVTIGSGCIVGAGAVVAKDLSAEETFYGGVPARALRSLAGTEVVARTDIRFMPRGSGRTAGSSAS